MIIIACILFICGGIIVFFDMMAITNGEEGSSHAFLIGVALVMTSFVIGHFAYTS